MGVRRWRGRVSRLCFFVWLCFLSGREFFLTLGLSYLGLALKGAPQVEAGGEGSGEGLSVL